MGFIWKKCSVNRYKFKYPYRYDGLNIPRGMRERWSTRNNRIAFCLLTFWSIFEFGLCLGILLSKESNKHDYPENFLNGICTKSCETPSNKNCKHSCERFISYGLIARCVTSITLFIGIFVDSIILMVPWFLNNAIGVFPLGPMIVSAFSDYAHAHEAFESLQIFWKILSAFLRAVLDLFVAPAAQLP